MPILQHTSEICMYAHMLHTYHAYPSKRNDSTDLIFAENRQRRLRDLAYVFPVA